MRLIFICKANSVLSQLAVSLARSIFDASYTFENAGTASTKNHPFVARILQELGVVNHTDELKSLESLAPTSLDSLFFLQKGLDPQRESHENSLVWDMHDPALPMTDEATCLQRFRETALQLQTKLWCFYTSRCLEHGYPRLWMHYKNKPYRVNGYCHHSETQEKLVRYETLYETDLGSHWVRPYSMFVDTLMIEGRCTPRFRPVLISPKKAPSSELPGLWNWLFSYASPCSIPLSAPQLKDARTTAYTMSLRNAVIGLSFASIDSSAHMSLCVFVAPLFRKMGIGGQLFSALTQRQTSLKGLVPGVFWKRDAEFYSTEFGTSLLDI